MKSKKTKSDQPISPEIDFAPLLRDISVIARSFAVIAMRLAPEKLQTDAERATFLNGLGLDRKEIASLLGTTPGTISVRLSEAKKNSARSE